MDFSCEYCIHGFTVISALCCVIEECKSSVNLFALLSLLH